MTTERQIPERLAVMWQNSRKTTHGWEVPIQVASSDPTIGSGNVIMVVSLGGRGGIYSTKDAVEATAEAIVRAYNAIEQIRQAIAEAEDAGDLVFTIAELVGVKVPGPA
jgi:hypothetical protein